MALKSQFLPRLKIKHPRHQRQHIQNRERFGSSVRLFTEDTVNSVEVSITDHTFAEVTTCLDDIRTLWEKFDKICGMAF